VIVAVGHLTVKLKVGFARPSAPLAQITWLADDCTFLSILSVDVFTISPWPVV